MSKRARLMFLLIFVTVIFYSCKPEILSFSPNRGGENTTVTIKGSHFKPSPNQNTVRIGEVIASNIIQASENEIVFKVPANAISGKISVETSEGITKSDAVYIVGSEKGYSLSIGLNAVDSNHYAGWIVPQLEGCEPDANNMTEIARSQGFVSETLLGPSANRNAVLTKLKDYANKLMPGDLLVVSYSGHGGQVPDQNGDEADDGLDETWCLYDGQLLDDELYQAWSGFKDGVRIAVFSDSCHSGTVLKMIKQDYDPKVPKREEYLNKNLQDAKSKLLLQRSAIRDVLRKDAVLRNKIRDISPNLHNNPVTASVTDSEIDAAIQHASVRVIPWQILMGTYLKNKEFYDNIGKSVSGENSVPVLASVVLISGCQDNEGSMDLGEVGGLFTYMLKWVWGNGSFSGDYLKFQSDIKNEVQKYNKSQSPNFFSIGSATEIFSKQKPYTIKYE